MSREKEYYKTKFKTKLCLLPWILFFLILCLPGCATQCAEPVRQLDDITGYA